MPTVNEIVLPATQPETEWIGGQAVQKAMPTTDHSIIQKAFLDVLSQWADAESRGLVGAEWRFRVSRPDIPVHPLVPDVAYMSFPRLRSLPAADRQAPTLPPEIVVEVLSPDDKSKNVKRKREDFLAWGVILHIIADPQTRTIEFFDADGGYHKVDGRTAIYTHPAFSDLHFPIQAIFAKLDIFASSPRGRRRAAG
jgi:Uma2 family endonuclease